MPAEFISLYVLNLINLISPGPGGTVVIRNSMHYSRRIGFFTGLGIVCCSLFHKTYTMVGFGLIVKNTPWLYLSLKYLGSSYLIYLGLKTLFMMRRKMKTTLPPFLKPPKKEEFTYARAFRMGFIVDLLNPMASFSFLCIVMATVSPDTSNAVRYIYIVCLIMTSFVWYSLLAFTFSHKFLQNLLHRAQHFLDSLMGGYLIYLGIRLAFAIK